MTIPTSSDTDRGQLVRLKNLRDVTQHEAELEPAPQALPVPEEFKGRWTRRQWAHASLFATLGALVAAIVPGFDNAMQGPVRVQRTTMSLTLPQIPLSRLRGHSGDSWQIVSVARGQTLSHVFEGLGIPATDLQRLLDHPGVKQSLTQLKPGTELAFDLPVDGKLRSFRYDRDDTHRVELSLAGDTVREKVIERPTETRTVVISGEVGKSLFHSARKLGMSGSNITTLTDEIFKYDIDFNSDVGSKDRFSARPSPVKYSALPLRT